MLEFNLGTYVLHIRNYVSTEILYYVFSSNYFYIVIDIGVDFMGAKFISDAHVCVCAHARVCYFMFIVRVCLHVNNPFCDFFFFFLVFQNSTYYSQIIF